MIDGQAKRRGWFNCGVCVALRPGRSTARRESAHLFLRRRERVLGAKPLRTGGHRAGRRGERFRHSVDVVSDGRHRSLAGGHEQRNPRAGDLPRVPDARRIDCGVVLGCLSNFLFKS
jgi:hypothetical protein